MLSLFVRVQYNALLVGVSGTAKSVIVTDAMNRYFPHFSSIACNVSYVKSAVVTDAMYSYDPHVSSIAYCISHMHL